MAVWLKMVLTWNYMRWRVLVVSIGLTGNHHGSSASLIVLFDLFCLKSKYKKIYNSFEWSKCHLLGTLLHISSHTKSESLLSVFF